MRKGEPEETLSHHYWYCGQPKRMFPMLQRQLASEFGQAGGVGEKLHAVLEERQAECISKRVYPNVHWLEEWWDNLAYLSMREPLPCGTNIFGTLLDTTPHPRPLTRAASLVHAACRFHLALAADRICPDSLDTKGNIPLCDLAPTRTQDRCACILKLNRTFLALLTGMFQFSRLFASTRVPGDPRDEFVTTAGSRHIAVLAYGHMAELEVIDEAGLHQQHATLNQVQTTKHTRNFTNLPNIASEKTMSSELGARDFECPTSSLFAAQAD